MPTKSTPTTPSFPSHPECNLCPKQEEAKNRGIPTIHLPTSLPPSPTTPALIVIGQNPGYHENLLGAPFVGASGDLLRGPLLTGSRLTTLTSIYLTNVLRCGPEPETPIPWCNTCFTTHTLPDLSRIFATHTSAPLALLLLGGVAVRHTFRHLIPYPARTKPPTVKLRDAIQENGRTYLIPNPSTPATHLRISIFATYHPAAILRLNKLILVTASHLELVTAFFRHDLDNLCKPSITSPYLPH